MKIIEALKKNEKPFGLISEVLRNEAKRIGRSQFHKYYDSQWEKLPVTPMPFLTGNTYRLCSSYEEKPEIVKCERKGDSYERVFPDGSTKIYDLFECLECKSFAGFLFECGMVRVDAMAYKPKDGYEGVHHRTEINGLKSGEIEVMRATHALFQEAAK